MSGGIDAMEQLALDTGARRVLVTLTDAPGPAMRRIVAEASRLGLEVRTAPPASDLFNDELDAYKVRRIRLEDLLRRPPVSEHVEGVTTLSPDARP